MDQTTLSTSYQEEGIQPQALHLFYIADRSQWFIGALDHLWSGRGESNSRLLGPKPSDIPLAYVQILIATSLHHRKLRRLSCLVRAMLYSAIIRLTCRTSIPPRSRTEPSQGWKLSCFRYTSGKRRTLPRLIILSYLDSSVKTCGASSV